MPALTSYSVRLDTWSRRLLKSMSESWTSAVDVVGKNQQLARVVGPLLRQYEDDRTNWCNGGGRWHWGCCRLVSSLRGGCGMSRIGCTGASWALALQRSAGEKRWNATNTTFTSLLFIISISLSSIFLARLASSLHCTIFHRGELYDR
nr:hypothetical protein CFP56_03891 [Quercus suber]